MNTCDRPSKTSRLSKRLSRKDKKRQLTSLKLQQPFYPFRTACAVKSMMASKQINRDVCMLNGTTKQLSSSCISGTGSMGHQHFR